MRTTGKCRRGRIGAALRVFSPLLMLLAPMAAHADPSHAESVKRQGEIRVCIWPDYYSITYRDTRTGELTGIDIDLARELGKDLGLPIRFIDSSFKTLVDDLTQDRCDVSMHGIGITPARQQKLDFTPPHLKSGIYAIVTKTNPLVHDWDDIDRSGVVVAVQSGTYMVEVMRMILKHATLSEVATPEAREQEVLSGRADVFMTDYPYSRKMLARHDWARLLAPPQPLAPTPYAYAFVRNDPAWAKVLGDFVTRIKADGRLLRAAQANGLGEIVYMK